VLRSVNAIHEFAEDGRSVGHAIGLRQNVAGGLEASSSRQAAQTRNAARACLAAWDNRRSRAMAVIARLLRAVRIVGRIMTYLSPSSSGRHFLGAMLQRRKQLLQLRARVKKPRFHRFTGQL